MARTFAMYSTVTGEGDPSGQQTLDTDATAAFWRARFAAVGHTGWSDQLVYQFDQRCRLQAFSSWLRETFTAAGSALDFGCGSGDFSRLLVNLNWTVTGFDKYVRPGFVHPQFRYVAVLSDLSAQEYLFDLIVSITVMDHITDDREFLTTLASLRRLVKPSGRFFFLEYSPHEILPVNSYQAFRPMDAWKRCLDETGFVLKRVEPFFHPESASISAWEAYRTHRLSRMSRKLARNRFVRRFAFRLLSGVAAHSLRRHIYKPPAASPIHILTGVAA
jgi:2-polyprenyl-3-methyl-5-hydroxy-6-metoxy-1,4-benzoquinol methylase